MSNVMMLLRGDDSQSPRHGGMRQYRSFHLFINGIEIKTFRDDDPATSYYSDRSLDDLIDKEIFLLELALSCKCIRGELKLRLRKMAKSISGCGRARWRRAKTNSMAAPPAQASAASSHDGWARPSSLSA